MARKALTKKTRFEVFKRDSFSCQYCGRAAPIVVLNVDHIRPVADGGGSEILNLITSCFDCNSGKSDRLLNDDTVLAKQMLQAKLLSEKREQIKMIASWRQSLKDLDLQELEVFEEYFDTNFEISLSDFGKSHYQKTIKKYGLSEVLMAVDKSANQYLVNRDSDADRKKFMDMIERICYWQKRESENPFEAEFRKFAYTANKIWYRCNPRELSHRLIFLHKKEGIPKDDIYQMVKASTGIMRFEELVQEHINSEV
jgi:hypothetical protein